MIFLIKITTMINREKVGHQWCRLFIRTDASILYSYFTLHSE